MGSLFGDLFNDKKHDLGGKEKDLEQKVKELEQKLKKVAYWTWASEQMFIGDDANANEKRKFAMGVLKDELKDYFPGL